jgi:hypothetical protein
VDDFTPQLKAEREKKAIDIAVKAGALKMCAVHQAPFCGRLSLLGAYKLANKLYGEDGNIQKLFLYDRRFLTDYVKDAFDDHSAAKCPTCG